QRCPDVIQRPARPEADASAATLIMDSLEAISPDIEIYSVDEAFMDVTRCQSLQGTPVRMARMVMQRVKEVSGLDCSVGVGGDKTSAKFAAKLNKPNGLGVIPPWEARERLRDVPVTELSGIAQGVGRFLHEHGVETCGQVPQLPISVLARRFGNIGRRIWLMCQGEDPDRIHPEVPAPKSVGHGKVMPPDTTHPDIIQTYLLPMSEKVGTRLRRHNLEASHFLIGLRTRYGWLGEKPRLAAPTDDSRSIFRLGQEVLARCWQGQPVGQIQLTALDPRPRGGQLDMFVEVDEKREQTNQAVDKVNNRYGELTVAPARLINKSDMPNVIAPSWKPKGHRQTI
ncbi:MAG: DNA polymerase IV, partial [Gammaproteobacteria bacterium]|nr:DNA polymerase IV [Gammaproteobacteria bacterium]